MIQLPYEFGLPEENESPSSFQREEFKASKTPSHQGVESETSFDSGYFSPPVSTRASQAYQRDSALLPIYQQSPAKISHTKAISNSNSTTDFQFSENEDLTSLPAILDDWDQNFIDNFQENLFGFDNIDDIGFIDGVLRSSPLKSPYKTRIFSPSKMRQYSPGNRMHGSPARHQFSPVRGQWSPVVSRHFSSSNKRTIITPPRHQKATLTSGNSTSQLLCDKTVTRLHSPAKATSAVCNMSAENVNCLDLQRTIKQEPVYETITDSMSCLPRENAYFQIDDPNFNAVRNPRVLKATENFTNIVPLIEVQNHSRSVFGAPPNKLQRMEPKRPLAQKHETRTICASKQKLQMARAHFKISLDRAIQTAASRHLQKKSDKYPQLSKALTKKSAAGAGCLTQDDETDPPETDTDALPFERYSEATAGSGYEVKRKSDCKVVIRKQSK